LNPTESQRLREIHALTSHTWIFSKLANIFWRLGEWLCYLILVIFVILAIVLPVGDIPLAGNESVELVLKIEEVRTAFLVVKGCLVLAGLLMLLPAILLRKIIK
jgi:hypothetical protein